jgi:hypothetical protein
MYFTLQYDQNACLSCFTHSVLPLLIIHGMTVFYMYLIDVEYSVF